MEPSASAGGAPPENAMKRVCAWCNREMGIVENSEQPDSVISHGVCPHCVNNLTFQGGVSVQTYLDSIPIPVVMVGIYQERIIVKAVNKSACAALGKEPQEMGQHLGGNVFECANARLPEGCGRTIHCSACTIRRTVLKTYETGEPQSLVPALLKQEKAGVPASIAMYISTVKAENMVMLRVDNMVPATP